MNVINIIPLGALGHFKGFEFLRILWILKLRRINIFDRTFDQYKFQRFFKILFDARIVNS